MRNTFYFFIFILIVHYTYKIDNCSAQWQPDVRLTTDPYASYTSNNNARCIASSGDSVHVVWYDERDGNQEIYYKRSTDGGVGWGLDTRLTSNPSTSRFPSVSVSGPVVHVVWEEFRDGNLEIYYKRSTNGGISWGADIRLTTNTASSLTPSVTVSGSVVHIVWYDERDGNKEIYYKRSSDGGVSWGADTRLTTNAYNSYSPSVSVSGSVVHVVWYDNRDGNNEIYYKLSTDGGSSWGADTRLTSNSSASSSPSVSVSGSVVHVVWYDERDGNFEIYYKRSTNGGLDWGSDTRLTSNSDFSYSPSVSVSGSIVHVVWYDHRDGNVEIYYKRSTDGGIIWGSDTRLTIMYGGSYYPSVSVSGLVVHVVWYDDRDGNQEIYYKRDPTGNPTGIQNINSNIPKEYKLNQNYPNPFNPVTKIKYQIPSDVKRKTSNVKLIIYDIAGKEIQTLVNEEQQPGTFEVTFDGINFPSGVYFYKLITGDFVETKKMLMIK